MARRDAATADEFAVVQLRDRCLRFKFSGKRVRFVAIELCVERRSDTQRVRLGGQRRVVEDRERAAFDACVMERLENPHGVSAAPAARIVGNIGKKERRFARVVAGFQRHACCVGQCCELRDIACAVAPRFGGDGARGFTRGVGRSR